MLMKEIHVNDSILILILKFWQKFSKIHIDKNKDGVDYSSLIKLLLLPSLLDEPLSTIKNRKFGERLTFFKKLLLYKEIEIRKRNLFDTWRKFRISKSTMYKILKDFKRIGKKSLDFMKYKKDDTKFNFNCWSYFKYMRKLSLSIYCKWCKPESFQNASSNI